jgi:hypothetical protein
MKRIILLLLMFLLTWSWVAQTAVATREGSHFAYLPLVTYYPGIGPNRLPNASFEGGWYQKSSSPVRHNP